tara:strand:- start:1912 stop:2190 length:279 start_codon:yes stop_codon:yes gene_type:complete
MAEFTKKQMEYIDSIDVEAHMSAVQAIGDLDRELDQAKQVIAAAVDLLITYGQVNDSLYRSENCLIKPKAMGKYQQVIQDAGLFIVEKGDDS